MLHCTVSTVLSLCTLNFKILYSFKFSVIAIENAGCAWCLEFSSNSTHHFFVLKNSFVCKRFVHIIFRCQYFYTSETENTTVVSAQGMPFLALVQASRCNILIVVLQFCLIGCMEMGLVLNVLLGYVDLTPCDGFNFIFLCHLGGLALNASVLHWHFSLRASLNTSGLFCL